VTPIPGLRRRFDVLLVAVDLLSVVVVTTVAYRLRFEGDPSLPSGYVRTYQAAVIALAPSWVIACRLTGLYRRGALRPGVSNLEAAFAAASTTGGLLLGADYLVFDGDLSRAWVGLVVLGLLLSALLIRGVLRRSRRALVPLGIALERYAVVGAGVATRRLVDDLTRAPGAPFKVVATLSADQSAEAVVEQVRGLRLDGLVLPPGEVTIAARLAALLSGSGVDVLVAPQFGDLELRVANIAMLQGVPLLRVAGMAPRRSAQRVAVRDRGRHGVAILGTRGVPANYGGFETFAERLALRLVDEGVATTVYCRSHYASERKQWRGIHLVTLPTIQSKYFDTVVHTGLSAAHLVLSRGPRDVVLCNAANAPVLLLLRLFRRRVILNVDGLEWRRSKWGVAGRSWYRLGEWLSVRLASVLVTDAHEVQTYYRVRHDTDSVMIPYGADLLERGALPVPAEVSVVAEGFALYVSRWERENNPLMVVRAHTRASVGLSLVMLGEATYDADLSQEVHDAAGPAAHLPGALFGSAYRGLQVNASCYIHATEVGGTHPALIEAMGAGNLCLVLDTPENREVAGAAAVFFADEQALVDLLEWADSLPTAERDRWRERSRQHAADTYSWDIVGRAYLSLIRGPEPFVASD
jgi:glycosyltransferase involved in cell wall biosynthesis